MNIVQVEDFFHPDAGYQANILAKYMVQQGHKVTVIAAQMDKIPEGLTAFFGRDDIEARDRAYTTQTGVDIVRLPLSHYISGRVVYTKEIFKVVDNLNPDVLYVHGNDTLTAIRFLLRLKSLKYPVVTDSHMLEMASENRFSKWFRLFYRTVVTPQIVKHQIKVIRTQNDLYVEKCLGIPLQQSPFISIGSDTLLFHPDEVAKQEFRKAHNIQPEDFVVLYAGKLDEAKGGLLLANTFQKRFPTDKNVVLLAVGKTSSEYGAKVEAAFADSENRIIRFPTQKYVDLATFYQAADMSVFPRQCSLSFYDVQACGLPVVSEDNSVNIDRLQHENGFVFQAGDVQSFREAISRCINMDEHAFAQMKMNAVELVKRDFDYADIAKQYTSILVDEYNRFRSR